MKALSIQSPHAQRIALGQKTLEIRSRRTHYRGDVLICVSKRGGQWAVGSGQNLPAPNLQSPTPNQQPPTPDFRGMALCIVEIWGCRQMLPGDEADACHPFVPGAFVWKLRNVRAIRPFPVTGKLGFFTVDDGLIVEGRSDGGSPRIAIRGRSSKSDPQFPRTIEHRLLHTPGQGSPLPVCESRSSFALV